MIGKTISHYKILEKIGGGGMGVVYKAQDTKLDRFVALKFLPPHLSQDEGNKKRFIHEAKAASALNHPNIAHIYGIDEVDGQMFIAMEYIEGKPLQDMLLKGEVTSPLTLNDVFHYASQIAEGLSKAHIKNITHRDIKPANILVTEDGIVKIVDFGLAKLAGRTMLTQGGTTLGTVAYMSPEQAKGANVDHRTDIWALGAVIYEMITGKQAFAGDYEQAVIYSIMNEDPEPPTALRTGVPMELERIVLKALAKEPGVRYQHVGEMLVDLTSLIENVKETKLESRPTKETAKGKRTFLYASIATIIILLIGAKVLFTDRSAGEAIDSIALLPLENLSGDANQEYFADGMTEALIADMAQISSLRVISRTSVMQYKGASKPLTEIARELNVDAILEGSVFHDGERVRITAQLIEASTDRHLWAQSYERDLKDILALHSEVARAVSREIKITLTTDEKKRLATTRPVVPAAHETFLKGRYHLHQYIMGAVTTDRIRTSIEYFQHAIELDPEWALPHAALASAYHFLASSQRHYEFYPKSKAAALRALELDETVSQAHSSLAFVLHRFDWDWEGAEREYRRAVELDPNSHGWGVALFFMSAGRYEEAIAWYQLAEERLPFSVAIKAQLGHAYTCAGQYDKGIERLHNTLEMNPNNAWARYFLADTYLRLSRREEAIAESQKAVGNSEGEPEFLAQLGYAYAVNGRRDEALKTLEQYKKEKGEYFVVELAALYLALGKKDQALAALQEAFEKRSPDLLYIRHSTVYDSLRDNPSFQRILRGINFPKADSQIETLK